MLRIWGYSNMRKVKKSFEQRVLESAIRAVVLEKGSYSKPSEVRAILRDPRYEVTKRGAVKKRAT